jgi:tRNA wybutosine-synthesizing protein 1
MGVGCCSSTANAVVTRENAVPATDDGGSDDLSTDSSSEDDDDDDDDDNAEGGDIVDVEDMGDVMKEQSIASRTKVPLEMVTPKQAKALKKEGYRLIGTHSAVKLCRWTKHQLRGRGGCYKHTHYGITSYQCMEATPSLACANKCVFCWRHHKNPVGKEWRWKTDDPLMIVEEAVREHVSMIKETRGIPGIQMDRWNEAHTVKHCALSLVGEPIMYPRINDLLGELHRRKISTFLVTNGQHPKAIEDLIPITQLVS